RARAVVDQRVPAGIDALQENLGEDPLDQLPLGRKIAVEQRLGDAEALGELPRLSAETHLGEIPDGARQDLLLAVGGGEAAAAARCRGSLLRCRRGASLG